MTAMFYCLEDAATFCAVLVRQGVTFKMQEHHSGWLVTFTGGY